MTRAYATTPRRTPPAPRPSGWCRCSWSTKHLEIDWREGAAWFARRLLDADVANNWGNWQWVAGAGNDTKPYRRFNPERQAERFDPDGLYRRRWLAESVSR